MTTIRHSQQAVRRPDAIGAATKLPLVTKLRLDDVGASPGRATGQTARFTRGVER